ncbi:MAG TPA: DUF982 domain-containing protein [Pseudorhizobium sp.]|jgi:hypothetical protein|nr:DUF982 domain-containing protein [Pseudorhizobium sp.]
MLVARWDTPVVIEDEGLRISVGSPEEALTWLSHAPNRRSGTWQRAWRACVAAKERKVPPEDAKAAVEQAVSTTRH